MKIVINKLLAPYTVNGVNLMPGSNVVNKDFATKSPQFEKLVSAGKMVVHRPSEMTGDEKKQAIAHANTKETLKKVGKAVNSSDAPKQETAAEKKKRIKEEEALEKEEEEKAADIAEFKRLEAEEANKKK